MQKPISAVVPVNIDRPKRIAKALHKLFSQKQLAQCQATTAHLFGFADWHNLEQAVKKGAAQGPFDEEISDDQLEARYSAQRSIVAAEIGDVDLDAVYPAPERNSPSFSDIFWERREARLHAARQRLDQLLATDAIYELTPTSRSHPMALEPFDALSVYRTEELAALPANLARWWKVNVKHQPEVAQAIASHEFDVKSGTSVLLFGHYWGTLCMYYAETINPGMIMGSSYLLAEGYAAAKIQDTATYGDFVPRFNAATDAEKRAWFTAVSEVKSDLEGNFYRAFPRDDLMGIGPEALLANAEKCKEVLATPKSRWGVWKDR